MIPLNKATINIKTTTNAFNIQLLKRLSNKINKSEQPVGTNIFERKRYVLGILFITVYLSTIGRKNKGINHK